ncbi:MAG: transposase [Bacteroidota bacterium]
MQKPLFTIGVDVSKNTLDLYCIEVRKHIKISNNHDGFMLFHSFCKKHNIDLTAAFVLLEYTGGYEYKWIQHCASKDIPFARVPGLAIKRSLGITRGKTDKIDAARIAQFADEKHKQLSPQKPVNITILQLKDLLAFRKRLVRENAGYKASIQERKHMYEVGNSDFMMACLLKKLKANEKLIEQAQQKIMQLVASDEALHHNFQLLKSIKGIGNVNAWMTIVYTENFTSFQNARTYAVYVGVIPFDYSSGTSIRGPKRVSHVANKELKQELNQAAKSAIQWDKETQQYAERKLQTKHYGIVLNNVKFKLILRMFAVIKRGENYVDRYTNVA